MKRSQQQTQTTPTGPVPVGSATKSRRGFTLVELLVVIAIIGVLISLLAVAIGPVLRTVYDGAVTSELKQLEQAIESFRTQYGFYPPSFAGFNNTASNSASYDPEDPHASDASSNLSDARQLLPYLNKISPNHSELTAMPGDAAGRSRLEVWWTNIGRHLDDRSSLVFWLTGVCANKQFPLTGNLLPINGMPQLPAAFPGSEAIGVTSDGTPNGEARARDVNGNEIDIPRDSFIDLRAGQLSDMALALSGANAGTVSPQLPAGLRVYTTPFGEEGDDRGNEYSYRNSAFYTSPGSYYADNNGNPRFVNPDTFQLFTYGLDGRADNIALDDTRDPTLSALNDDNITNFANGRLETFDWRINLGL